MNKEETKVWKQRVRVGKKVDKKSNLNATTKNEVYQELPVCRPATYKAF